MVATDNEILDLLHQGDDKGLELMMNTYIGLVYTIVHSKIATICSREDIEECASDVFYELYKNSEKVDLNKGSLKAFLVLVAKRKAIDIYRKHSKQNNKVISLDAFDFEEAVDLESDSEKIYSDKQTRNRIIQEIKALGEPDSEILIRKYFFQQPSKVISEVMKIKTNTVDKRISRALIKLKKIWEGESENGNKTN
jgi:RNA polymerase sigma-70 factor (ECF subfamily)